MQNGKGTHNVPPAPAAAAAPQAGRRPFSEREKNRIATLLERRLRKEELSTRAGPKGSQLTYVESFKVFDMANKIFGFDGWSSSITNISKDYLENVEGGKVNVGVSAVVRVTLKDGSYHEDIGYGTSDNVKGTGSAVQKAKKEAVSDGRKRALRLFGPSLGNCIYDKRYLQDVRSGRGNSQTMDQLLADIEEKEEAALRGFDTVIGVPATGENPPPPAAAVPPSAATSAVPPSASSSSSSSSQRTSPPLSAVKQTPSFVASTPSPGQKRPALTTPSPSRQTFQPTARSNPPPPRFVSQQQQQQPHLQPQTRPNPSLFSTPPKQQTANPSTRASFIPNRGNPAAHIPATPPALAPALAPASAPAPIPALADEFADIDFSDEDLGGASLPPVASSSAAAASAVASRDKRQSPEPESSSQPKRIKAESPLANM